MRRAFLLLSLLVLAGCDSEPWLVLESEGSYAGTVSIGSHDMQVASDGGRTSRFPLEVGERVCWTFRRGKVPGFLRVYVERPSLTAPERVGFAESTAPGGVVSGCA